MDNNRLLTWDEFSKTLENHQLDERWESNIKLIGSRLTSLLEDVERDINESK